MPRRKQLKTINKQITALQAELFDLYRERQRHFLSTDDFPSALRAAVAVPAHSADYWYQLLEEEWAQRDIKIPAKRVLLPKIKAGLTVAAQLAGNMQVSADLFTLVLVPPSKLGTPDDINTWRQAQPHVSYADKHDYELKTEPNTDWRLLVVYDALDGLELGSAAELIARGDHIIGGMDTRALGIYEYQIYSLRDTQPRDHHVWTLLLKHEQADPISVSFIHGSYRFMQDDARGIGDAERFRPAVEVQ